jgi:hypothetical protein
MARLLRGWGAEDAEGAEETGHGELADERRTIFAVETPRQTKTKKEARASVWMARLPRVRA